MLTEEMRFDWDGLIRLLAQNLYSEKSAFLRELIQNAHDAVLRHRYAVPGFGGRIDIRTDTKTSTIVVEDNGIGMDDSDLADYLSTIGIGATRAQQNIPGLVGHFGIGFLSAFVVAEKVRVETRKLDQRAAWVWENTGSRTYTIDSCSRDEPGTRVTVWLTAQELGLLHEAEIRRIVNQYADLLGVPIHINMSERPANTMVGPWERQDITSERRKIDSRLYIAEITGDDALEIIPIEDEETRGLLYITRQRVLGVDSPRSVRVFLRRMFISDNIPELLPPWASFVNGIVDSDSLHPTAGRDNVVRDPEFEQLRERLGNLIVSHLDELRDVDPQRFSEILRYHELSIRAACAHYEPFFRKFVHLLEWKTSRDHPGDERHAGDRRGLTLPELVSAIHSEQPGAAMLKLRCFGHGSTSGHLFRLAEAAGATVVDASDYYEMQLLEEYVRSGLSEHPLELVRIDREDDSMLFRYLGPGEAPDIERLAAAIASMRLPIPAEYSSDVEASRTLARNVVARRFEPESLPALVSAGEGVEEVNRALDVLEDPDSPPMYRALAESVLKSSAGSVTVIINANNPIIQRLSELQEDMAEDARRRLLLGVYNSAFLSSSMMSERNAAILHDNLVHFIDATLRAEARLADLSLRNETLAEDLAMFTRQRTEAAVASTDVITAFVMIPFAQEYEELLQSLRDVVEGRWGCRLFIASDRKYEDRILDSIQVHLAQADLFVAEVSDANPNVMFELGAVFGDRRGRPVVALVHDRDGRADVHLPADLQSLIYVNYSESALPDDTTLSDHLAAEMRKDVQIEALLSSSTRQRYVPAQRLRELSGHLLNESEAEEIVRELPTEEAWLETSDRDVESLLPSEKRDLATVLTSRIKESLRNR